MVRFEFDRRAFKTIAIKFLALGLPLLIMIYFGLNLVYKNKLNTIKNDVEKQQEELVSLYEYHFISLFKNMFGDLNIIKNADELQQYLTKKDKTSLKEAGEMFTRVLQSKPSIYQLRFLSLDGNEIIRVDNKNNQYLLKTNKFLQNKKSRYYFKSLEKTQKNTLYISDFDLNIESGKIEIPYRPTIRFGIPVYHNNKKKGYLIINVDGIYILDTIRNYEESEASDIKIGLSDRNHLINLNTLDINETIESSFIRNREGENPLDNKIDISKDKGRFVYKDTNYLYNRINLNHKEFKIYFEENGGGQWKILSSYTDWQIINDKGDFFIKHKSIKLIILLVATLLIIVIIFLITEKEAEHLLLLATGVISDSSHDGILITNNNRKVIYCNPIFEKTFGYKLPDIKGKSPKEFFKGKRTITINNNSSDEIVWEGNIWDITANNIHIQKYLKLKTVSSSSKQIAYYIGIYTETKKLNNPQHSQENAPSYSILDVHNLNELAPILLSSNVINNTKRIMIAIKIIDFATLRNSLTYEEEKNLISRITNELKKELGNDCLIIAPYSDLLFIEFPHTGESLEHIMNRVDDKIISIKFEDPTRTISYFSGVSLSPDHGVDTRELIEKAYIALEAINRIKNSKYILYNQNIFEEVNQYHQIKKEFNNAFLNEEFNVVYQPQNDTITGEIIGVEALVRWRNKNLGNVAPYLFIPIMEEDPSQIKKLGRYILLKVLKEWQDVLPTLSNNFRISINLSSQEFSDIDIVCDLISIINKSNFNTHNFCFEITETVLSENLNITNKIISTLHENNITVAIDDFGTGYSSLGYLKQLKTDKIKIDRVFIKDFPQSDDGSILTAIIKMAKELKIKVIIEGVETEDQLLFIKDLGCQEFQGYISSKPVKKESIIQMLAEEE